MPTRHTRLIAAGLAALAGGPVAAQNAPPAARLLKPQAVAPEPAGTVSRGTAGPADLTPVPARSAPRGGLFSGVLPPHPATPPTPVSASLAPPPDEGKSKSLLGTAWDDLVGLVKTAPVTPTPDAPGNDKPTAAGTGTAGTAAVGPDGRPVYAGPPAYRWFGWGSTTPGANPYAPNGQYPRASANWYSQAGATPGAFPVPSVNPFRSPPGTETPVYADSGVPASADRFAPPPGPLTGSVPLPAPTLPASAPPASAPAGTVAVPPPAGASAFDGFQPIAQTPPGFAPGFAPHPGNAAGPVIVFEGTAPPPPPVAEPVWQPASGPVPAPPPGFDVPPQWSVPVPLGQAPTGGGVVRTAGTTAADLEAVVRSACNGLVGGVQLRADGPGRVTVRFVAPSEAHARAAADAVSRVPGLKGYDVRFEARVPTP